MYDYELYKTSNVYNFKLIAFIIALAATIIIYFVFMDKRNKASYSNPLKRLYDYFKIIASDSNIKKLPNNFTVLFDIIYSCDIENSYKFSFEELKKYLKQLGNIDINIKTGVSANDYGFDLFLLNL